MLQLRRHRPGAGGAGVGALHRPSRSACARSRTAVLQPLRQLDGLRVLRPAQVSTQLEAEGWALARPVPGFQLASCVKRPATPEPMIAGKPARAEVLQAVFTDGLTHVSLFIEPFDAARHRKDSVPQIGATHTLTRPPWRLLAHGDG
jgi:sigma-E factor negative regulatory protein RseB